MKFFIAAIVIGTLAFAAASPVTAQSKPVSEQSVPVRVAAPDQTADRSSYTQRAQEEMRIWQQKLHDFDVKVQAKASEAQTRAAKSLNNAWAQTKTASARLETAGEKDWDSAKLSFKTASAKLAVAWHKVNPADK